MIEYCKSTHTDPSYEFVGTKDFGILDTDTRKLLMYSLVNQGEFLKFQIMAPFLFEDFISINKIKGRNLEEVFANGSKLKGMKVETECLSGEKAELLPRIMKDIEMLPIQHQTAFESIIAEVFD